MVAKEAVEKEQLSIRRNCSDVILTSAESRPEKVQPNNGTLTQDMIQAASAWTKCSQLLGSCLLLIDGFLPKCLLLVVSLHCWMQLATFLTDWKVYGTCAL